MDLYNGSNPFCPSTHKTHDKNNTKFRNTLILTLL